MELKMQKQQRISYQVHYQEFKLVYNFATKEKQLKKRRVWKQFFENFPGEIIVKNSVLTSKAFTIYACHFNLKCPVRVNLAITREMLDEPQSTSFKLVGDVRYMDKCICRKGSGDVRGTHENAVANWNLQEQEKRGDKVEKTLIERESPKLINLARNILDSSQPVNEEHLIKRMQTYNPFAFVPLSQIPLETLVVGKKINEGGRNEKPNESGDESDKTDVEQGKDLVKEPAEIDKADVSTPLDKLTPTENRIRLATLTEEDDEVHLCMVEDESVELPMPKEPVKFKFKFMKKFAEAAGMLSHSELEELLIEKITESIMYCTENTNLRDRMERLEEISKAYEKRLDNVMKQYQELQRIHNRVMKDLMDRPKAPITPVKITRAVGLQVYQPANKRPMEPESSVNGSQVCPNICKRKRITDITLPLRENDRAISITKALGSIPATVSVTVNGSEQVNKSAANTSSSNIDLTDDEEGNSTVAKRPPPAVFRHWSQPTIVAEPNRIAQYRPTPDVATYKTQHRSHPAPLPLILSQQCKRGQTRIPPRPCIRIKNRENGIIVSWTVDALTHEHDDIQMYQIYAYEETIAAPSSDNWKHVGNVNALQLPMAITLTKREEVSGQKHFFAVRAVDIHKRLGQFSIPRAGVFTSASASSLEI